ncbi:ABC transporter ATP-binding protein [Isobaculum melis]|uniref:ATP-binding cassette, subfamily B n=1 Tax=Isobaculum melis TaxID=142588 RepID=A0A1H9QFV8_9LACT|nr:ABC transporter ATP-binding protein [Isobaculum melis]SER59441.1 ATP-binding cassette, subfamily B [Isobaculum melis]
MAKQKSMKRKPQHLAKTLQQLLSYLMMNKLALFSVVICIILSTGAGIAGTYFIRPIINDYILPGDLGGLARILMVVGVIYLFGVLATYGYNRIMIQISQNTIQKLRQDLFDHLQDLPIGFFDRTNNGDIMSRFTNDVDNIQEALNNSVTQILAAFLTITGTFVMMLIISPILTIVIVVMVLVMILIIKVIGGKSSYYFGQQQQFLGNTNSYIEEYVEGQKVVKVFNHEDEVMAGFDVRNEALQGASQKAQTLSNAMMPILGNTSFVSYALTASLGGLMVVRGMLDIGSLGSFLQYSRTFSQPLSQVSQQTNTLLAALAGAERIFAIMEISSEVDDGTVTLERTETGNFWLTENQRIPVVGNIELKDVSFGYTPEEPVLKHINVWAKPGLKVAFVGATGAGKTTITNLINRFYEIDTGEILYDGLPITTIKKADLRSTMSIVLQDTHLFTGSVMENIRYGRLDASNVEVIEAAKLANAHDFIKRLPRGYDTILSGDGGNLSQGQRQLLAIARAAVANPNVLILDEATSSIDSHTEQLITTGMDQLMTGRTSFVIAHRLSTIRNADVIMVLDHGEIVERGNHEELIQKKGMYYKLYTGQIELD